MVGPYLTDGQMSSEDPSIRLASESTIAVCQEEFRSDLTSGLGIMIPNVTTTVTTTTTTTATTTLAGTPSFVCHLYLSCLPNYEKS